MTGPEDPFDPLQSLRPEAIAPLNPPDGAHQAVLRRAARRRARTAATVTGAVAAVVAVVVAVPLLTLGGSGQEQVANELTTTAPAPTTATPPPSPTSVAPGPAPSPAPAPTTSAPPPFTDDGQPTGPVPAQYAPESVTFVSPDDGWTLGQAPCATAPCTSVTRTQDGGRRWVGTAAPRAGPVQGTRGVDQLRFGSPTDGWAFGGELWSTHDGTSWNPVALPANTAVVSLAADRLRVVAAYARCDAGGCNQTTLRTGNNSGDEFTQMPGSSTLPGRAEVTMQAGTVWATSVTNGTVHLVRGAADGSQPVRTLSTPCSPDTISAHLAARTGTDVALACQQNGGAPIQVYRSTDGGEKWGGGFSLDLPGAPQSGSLSSLSLSPSGVLLVANDAGALLRVPAGSTTAQDQLSGGFRFVGWTSSTQAVAVPVIPSPGLLYLTRDRGDNWAKLQVSS